MFFSIKPSFLEATLDSIFFWLHIFLDISSGRQKVIKESPLLVGLCVAERVNK